MIIIDCYTKDAKKLNEFLCNLKGISSIWFSKYALCPECTQFQVSSKYSAEELEDILYDAPGINYIGVVEK